jgi:ATP-binding cassette subfamily B protein/subfamily B ATP-binding cassette protein MsbA
MAEDAPNTSNSPESSRGRFFEYRRRVRKRPAKATDDAKRNGAPHDGSPREGAITGHGEGKSTKRSRSFIALLKAFWGLLRGHRATLAAALCTLAVSTALGLVPLYMPKVVFDNVLDNKPLPPGLVRLHVPSDQRKLLALVGVVMISVTVVTVIINIWGRWQATRITKRVAVAYRKQVFDHAVRLPLHRVYDLKSGGVASILREDAGGVGDLVFSMIYNPSRAIFQLVGSLIVLAFVNWRLLLGAVLLLPTVWLTHRTWINRIRPIFRDIRMTRQGIDAHAAEAFGGIRVVRAFGRRRSEAGRFTGDNHYMARQELFAWWWMRGIDIAWSLLIPVASALLLWFGAGKVMHDAPLVKAGLMTQQDAFTVGKLVMFLTFLGGMLGPIATLAESATGLQNQLAGFDRTLDLIAEPAEMPRAPDSIEVSRESVAGRITFKDVSFAYAESKKGKGKQQVPDERPALGPLVLHDVDLDVLPGEIVALVGPSGAGKTTLCNLVARFYDPTGGGVMLDGTDLRKIDADSYRRLLGIVEQDTFLFDGTIAQNISYGRREATRAQIVQAARQANAHEFIEKLDHGYETLIGERGVKLSGGQRQRLTIARAILADPKILILDEATSNLDTESERLIQSSLRALMLGRTSFVIAHRLSTIRHADRILVIEAGRIVEQGTHDELMARSGRYRQMVDLQTRPPEPIKSATAAKTAGEALAQA